jgi:S-adenosylmethionine synthetase
MARHVAKNIVAAGLARKCEVQLAYSIGVARPVSVLVDAFGTETIPRTRMCEIVNDVFDLRPAAIIEYLDLLRPIFKKTSCYGHFGRNDPDFTWEKTNMVDVLIEKAGVKKPRKKAARKKVAGLGRS